MSDITSMGRDKLIAEIDRLGKANAGLHDARRKFHQRWDIAKRARDHHRETLREAVDIITPHVVEHDAFRDLLREREPWLFDA